MSNYLFQNLTYDDEYLPDPFNPTFEAICNITAFSEDTIPLHLAYSPHGIARKSYNKVDWWWVLMLYNGVVSASELAPGVTIRIPDPQAVSFVLGQQLNEQDSSNDIVEI